MSTWPDRVLINALTPHFYAFLKNIFQPLVVQFSLKIRLRKARNLYEPYIQLLSSSPFCQGTVGGSSHMLCDL